MATYEEINKLALDTHFRERVQSAIVTVSESILAGTSRDFGGSPPVILPWSAMIARINLARSVQGSPGALVEIFSRKCANNGTINGSGIVSGTVTYYGNMDNDILYVVGFTWNEVAGV